MLMAGLDGITNEIHPGDSFDKDLYDLPPEELEGVPTVASFPGASPGRLGRGPESFLTAGGVFSNAMIDGYLGLKQEEVAYLNASTHPVEFEMYYSV